jgi:hypothetical protein
MNEIIEIDEKHELEPGEPNGIYLDQDGASFTDIILKEIKENISKIKDEEIRSIINGKIYALEEGLKKFTAIELPLAYAAANCVLALWRAQIDELLIAKIKKNNSPKGTGAKISGG